MDADENPPASTVGGHRDHASSAEPLEEAVAASALPGSGWGSFVAPVAIATGEVQSSEFLEQDEEESVDLAQKKGAGLQQQWQPLSPCKTHQQPGTPVPRQGAHPPSRVPRVLAQDFLPQVQLGFSPTKGCKCLSPTPTSGLQCKVCAYRPSVQLDCPPALCRPRVARHRSTRTT